MPGLLAVTLGRRGLFALDERCRKRLPRIVASALLMGGLLLAGNRLLSANYAEHAGFIAAAWGLLLLVTGGALSFFAIAHVTRCHATWRNQEDAETLRLCR